MKNEGIQLRISDLLYAFFKHRFLIAALTTAGLLIGLVLAGVSYLKGDISREYKITGSFAINTRVSDNQYSSGSSFVMSSDVQLAEDLSSAVIYVVDSTKTLDAAIASLRLNDVTASDVSSNLTLTQYENTHIVEAVLYWRDAAEGIALMNSINAAADRMLQDTLNVGGVSVIEPPSAHYILGGGLNAALCGALAVLGLAAGLAIAVLDLLIRPTLLTSRDLETVFNLDVLGEVPRDDNYYRQKGSVLLRGSACPQIPESFAPTAHIVRNRVGSRDRSQIIYVSSSIRGEGRTTAVANLALQLADMEKKVLMIDLDLRNPQLGAQFLENVEYDHSLNALYRGDINEQEAVTALTGNLDILPAVLERTAIPFDSVLFGMIRKLAQRYDYVLIDTAPVGLTAGTLSLNEIAAAALLVVRFDTASLQEIRDTLDRMDKSGVRLIGGVVNDLRSVSETRARRADPVRKKTASESFLHSTLNFEERYMPRQTFGEDLEEKPAEAAGRLGPDATPEDFTSMLFHAYSSQEEEGMVTPAKLAREAEAAEEYAAPVQAPAEEYAEAPAARPAEEPAEEPAKPAELVEEPVARPAKKRTGLFGKSGRH